MNAVILAGGRGKRMGMRTAFRPKPMQRVNGEPILAHQIHDYADAGVTDVYIAEGYRAGSIQRFFGDGRKYGVNIKHLNLGLDMPPGQKIKESLQCISADEPGERPVFVSNGDTIFGGGPEHLQALLNHHQETGASVTIDSVPFLVTGGVLIEAEDGRLKNVDEEHSLKVYAGLAVVQSTIHSELSGGYQFINEALRAFPDNVQVYSDIGTSKEWLHVSTKEDLKDARNVLRERG